jgi:hypothetical protein
MNPLSKSSGYPSNFFQPFLAERHERFLADLKAGFGKKFTVSVPSPLCGRKWRFLPFPEDNEVIVYAANISMDNSIDSLLRLLLDLQNFYKQPPFVVVYEDVIYWVLVHDSGFDSPKNSIFLEKENIPRIPEGMNFCRQHTVRPKEIIQILKTLDGGDSSVPVLRLLEDAISEAAKGKTSNFDFPSSYFCSFSEKHPLRFEPPSSAYALIFSRGEILDKLPPMLASRNRWGDLAIAPQCKEIFFWKNGEGGDGDDIAALLSSKRKSFEGLKGSERFLRFDQLLGHLLHESGVVNVEFVPLEHEASFLLPRSLSATFPGEKKLPPMNIALTDGSSWVPLVDFTLNWPSISSMKVFRRTYRLELRHGKIILWPNGKIWGDSYVWDPIDRKFLLRNDAAHFEIELLEAASQLLILEKRHGIGSYGLDLLLGKTSGERPPWAGEEQSEESILRSWIQFLGACEKYFDDIAHLSIQFSEHGICVSSDKIPLYPELKNGCRYDFTTKHFITEDGSYTLEEPTKYALSLRDIAITYSPQYLHAFLCVCGAHLPKNFANNDSVNAVCQNWRSIAAIIDENFPGKAKNLTFSIVEFGFLRIGECEPLLCSSELDDSLFIDAVTTGFFRENYATFTLLRKFNISRDQVSGLLQLFRMAIRILEGRNFSVNSSNVSFEADAEDRMLILFPLGSDPSQKNNTVEFLTEAIQRTLTTMVREIFPGDVSIGRTRHMREKDTPEALVTLSDPTAGMVWCGFYAQLPGAHMTVQQLPKIAVDEPKESLLLFSQRGDRKRTIESVQNFPNLLSGADSTVEAQKFIAQQIFPVLIRDSGLEGLPLLDTIDKVLILWNEFSQLLGVDVKVADPNFEVSSLRKALRSVWIGLEQVKQIGEERMNLDRQESAYEGYKELSARIRGEILRLPIGGLYTLPTGWMDPSDAHSCYIIYERLSDTTFSIHEVNGRWNAPSDATGVAHMYGTKTLPARYYRIPQKILFAEVDGQECPDESEEPSTHLFAALSMHNVRGIGDRSKEHSERNRLFYQSFFDVFAAYKQDAPNHLLGLFTRMQRSGNCVIKALDSMIMANLATAMQRDNRFCSADIFRLTRAFQLFADCRLLASFRRIIEEKTKTNILGVTPQEIEILRQGRCFLAYYVEKLHRFITTNEWDFFAFLTELAGSEMANVDGILGKTSLILKAQPKIPLPSTIAPKEITIDPIPASNPPANFILLNNPIPYPKIPRPEMSGRSVIMGVCDEFYALTELLNPTVQFPIIRICVRRLPMPDDGCWDTLSPEEYKKVFRALTRVLELVNRPEILEGKNDLGTLTTFLHIQVLQIEMLRREKNPVYSAVLNGYCVDDQIFRDAAFSSQYALLSPDILDERKQLIEYGNRQRRAKLAPAFLRFDGVGCGENALFREGSQGSVPLPNELEFWKKIVGKLNRNAVKDLEEVFKEIAISSRRDEYICTGWTPEQQLAASLFFDYKTANCSHGYSAMQSLKRDENCQYLVAFIRSTRALEKHYLSGKTEFCYLVQREYKTHIAAGNLPNFSSKISLRKKHEIKEENAALLSQYSDGNEDTELVSESVPSRQIISQIQDLVEYPETFFPFETDKKSREMAAKKRTSFIDVLQKIVVDHELRSYEVDSNRSEISPLDLFARNSPSALLRLSQRLVTVGMDQFYSRAPESKVDLDACFFYLAVAFRVRLFVWMRHPEMKKKLCQFSLFCHSASDEKMSEDPEDRLKAALVQIGEQIHCTREDQVDQMRFLRWYLAWDQLGEIPEGKTLVDLYVAYFHLSNFAADFKENQPQLAFVREQMALLGTKLASEKQSFFVSILAESLQTFLPAAAPLKKPLVEGFKVSFSEWSVDFIGGLVSKNGQPLQRSAGVGKILADREFIQKFRHIPPQILRMEGDSVFCFRDDRFGEIKINCKEQPHTIEWRTNEKQVSILVSNQNASRFLHLPNCLVADTILWKSKDGSYAAYDSTGKPIFRSKNVRMECQSGPGKGYFLELQNFEEAKDIVEPKEDVFYSFEAKGEFYFLTDSAGERKMAIFPRYHTSSGEPLIFQKSGNTWSPLHAQWLEVCPKASQNQHPFGTFHCTLALVNSATKGNRKWLLPYGKMLTKTTFRGTSTVQVQLSKGKGEFIDLRGTSPLLVAHERADPFSLLNQIHATDVASNLQLTYIYMNQNEYDRALNFLKAVGAINTLSGPCFEILRRIYRPHRDHSPAAAALVLRALLLQIQSAPDDKRTMDLLDYGPMKDEVRAEAYGKYYEIYLDALSHIPSHLRLTCDEELIFSDAIDRTPSQKAMPRVLERAYLLKTLRKEGIGIESNYEFIDTQYFFQKSTLPTDANGIPLRPIDYLHIQPEELFFVSEIRSTMYRPLPMEAEALRLLGETETWQAIHLQRATSSADDYGNQMAPLEKYKFRTLYEKLSEEGTSNGDRNIYLAMAYLELHIFFRKENERAMFLMALALKVAAKDPDFAREHPIPDFTTLRYQMEKSTAQQQNEIFHTWLNGLYAKAVILSAEEGGGQLHYDRNQASVISTHRYVSQRTEDFDIGIQLEHFRLEDGGRLHLLQSPQDPLASRMASYNIACQSLEPLGRIEELNPDVAVPQGVASAAAERHEGIIGDIRENVKKFLIREPSEKKHLKIYLRRLESFVAELEVGAMVLAERNKRVEHAREWRRNSPNPLQTITTAMQDSAGDLRKAIAAIENLLNALPEGQDTVSRLREAGFLRKISFSDAVGAYSVEICAVRRGIRGGNIQPQESEKQKSYRLKKAQLLALERLQKFNPHISVETYVLASSLTRNYIKAYNQFKQFQRIKGHLMELEKEANSIKENGILELLQRECSILPNVRPLKTDPDLELFIELVEFLNGGIRMYQQQIDATSFAMGIFSEESNGQGILQLGMGMGKSDILTPSWLHLITVVQQKMAWLTVDGSQFAAVENNLREKMSVLGLSVFSINPKTDPNCFSGVGLQRICRMIEENDRTHDRIFLITDEGRRMLLEQYYDALTVHLDVGKRRFLRRILEHPSISLVDEVHLAHNPKVSFTAAVPGSQKCLPPEDATLFRKIIANCVLDEGLASAMGICTNQQATLFDPKKWAEVIRPKVAQHLWNIGTEMGKLTSRDGASKDNFIAFIQGAWDGEDRAQDLALLGEQLPEACPHFLGLCRGILTHFLPNQLQRECMVGYGPGPDGLRCVPYKALNCPSSGWYRNPYEECMAETMMILQHPISLRQWSHFLDCCIDQAHRWQESTKTPFDMTPIAQEFKGKFKIPLHAFIPLQGTELRTPEAQRAMDAIFLKFLNGRDNSLPSMGKEFLENRLWIASVASGTIFSTEFIEVNSAELQTLSVNELAMTGTPLPTQERGNFFPDRGTTGALLLQLFDAIDQGNAKVLTVEAENPEKMLQSYFTDLKGCQMRPQALLDMAATLRLPPQRIIDIFLKLKNLLPDDIDGLLLWNGECRNFEIVRLKGQLLGEVVQLNVLNGEEFSRHGFDPARLFAIFDQEHCTGTNVPGFVRDAHGGLTLDPNSLDSKFLAQTAMRLREFGRGQQVDLLISSKGLQAWGCQISSANVWTVLAAMIVHNDTRQEMQLLELDFSHRLVAETRRTFREALRGNTFPMGKKELRRQVLVTEENFDMGAHYFSVAQWQKPVEWLRKHAEILEKQLRNSLQGSGIAGHKIEEAIGRQWRRMGAILEDAEREMPWESLGISHDSSTVEQQMQMETSTENNTTLQQELTMEQQYYGTVLSSGTAREEKPLLEPQNPISAADYFLKQGISKSVNRLFTDKAVVFNVHANGHNERLESAYRQYATLFHDNFLITDEASSPSDIQIPFFSQSMRRAVSIALFTVGETLYSVILSGRQTICVKEWISSGKFTSVGLYWAMVPEPLAAARNFSGPKEFSASLRLQLYLFNGNFHGLLDDTGALNLLLDQPHSVELAQRLLQLRSRHYQPLYIAEALSPKTPSQTPHEKGAPKCSSKG